jgi:phosphohistidine phosphatase
LSERGQREAPIAGELLAERVQSFDRVLVSTGLRAQQTWQAVAPSVRFGEHVDRSDLYLASSDELLTILHSLPQTVSTALLVGHNEGIEELASALSGVPVTMKTSTFAILRCPADWGAWQEGLVTLDEVVVAR